MLRHHLCGWTRRSFRDSTGRGTRASSGGKDQFTGRAYHDAVACAVLVCCRHEGDGCATSVVAFWADIFAWRWAEQTGNLGVRAPEFFGNSTVLGDQLLLAQQDLPSLVLSLRMETRAQLFTEVGHACCPRLRFSLYGAARTWALLGRATHVALGSTVAAPDGHSQDRTATPTNRLDDQK